MIQMICKGLSTGARQAFNNGEEADVAADAQNHGLKLNTKNVDKFKPSRLLWVQL